MRVRPRPRRLLQAAGLAAVAAVSYTLVPAARAGRRAPAVVPVVDAPAPTVAVVAGVRNVTNHAAPARLIPDSQPPSSRTAIRLLFYAGRASQPAGPDALVVDSAGRLFAVSGSLKVRPLAAELGGRVVASALRDASGTLWVADAAGRVTQVDRSGMVLDDLVTPFAYPALGGDPEGDAVWAVRSPQQFDFALASGESPVAVRLDHASRTGAARAVGTAIAPAHVLLTSLANAGHVVAAGDTVFFAPFIRDEVVAFGPEGDTLWVAARDLPQSTREPRFEVAAGRAVIDYHPVNLGLTRGLDGHLYVLSTPGFTMTASRLDVFDAASGVLVRTAEFATTQPTVGADREGRVYVIDPSRFSGRATVRPAAPPLQLPLLAGGDVSLDSLRGRVVLLNFWASWCTPCRREMPALDSLRQRLTDPAFTFLAVNEDRSVEAAQRFVDAFGFAFPVALGGGAMGRVFFYPGLPHTVLVDAHGRIARSWIGELTPGALSEVEAAVRLELDGPPPETRAILHGGHSHD